MKNNVVIADISSIKMNNTIYGHYGKVARMYLNLLGKNARAAGGPVYKNRFADSERVDLPYDFELSSMGTKKGRRRFKIYSIKNGIHLFKTVKNSVIVCQPYSFLSWMTAILLTKKRNKIYLIEYRNELDKKLNRILFKLAKRKIDGVLCPNDKVGRTFGLPYLVLTDYIYDKTEMPPHSENAKYDFGVIGIMSRDKDVADVVKTFTGTDYKVLIAGHFGGRKDEVCGQYTDNITVVDKYLTNEEYEQAFSDSDCIVLPYGDAYKNQSSGVIFDVLFRAKPVITKDFESFGFVKDSGAGVLYNHTLAELDFEKVTSKENKEKMYANVCRFIEQNKAQREKLAEFLDR